MNDQAWRRTAIIICHTTFLILKIAIIVAASENNAIGKDNRLIWRLPDDMKFFREKTSGHCVVTGRKNYESIPGKFRPLPARTNIVVTRQENYSAPGAIVVHSFGDAVAKAKELGETELWVIGGGEIYREALPVTDIVWLTRVHHHFDAHTFIPGLDPSQWEMTWKEEHPADQNHAYAFTFYKYERRKSL
ncbi:MAG TPA: dihydrofolate reductase [Bacteroidia bacterium]|nr:dihydrofolate reductase [Bacteroidia bacterium]